MALVATFVRWRKRQKDEEARRVYELIEKIIGAYSCARVCVGQGILKSRTNATNIVCGLSRFCVKSCQKNHLRVQQKSVGDTGRWVAV